MSSTPPLLSEPLPYPIISSICFVFVVIAVVAICTCCIIRRRPGEENFTPSASVNIAAPVAVAAAAGYEVPMTFYSTGGSGGNDDKLCAICLDDLVEGEEVGVLPRCKHTFHKDCIDLWTAVPSGACPICRGPVIPEKKKPKESTTASDA